MRYLSGERPETIQELEGRGGYQSRGQSGRQSQGGGLRQYKRWEVEAVIKVEEIMEAIKYARPETIQEAGGPRQYKR